MDDDAKTGRLFCSCLMIAGHGESNISSILPRIAANDNIKWLEKSWVYWKWK